MYTYPRNIALRRCAHTMCTAKSASGGGFRVHIPPQHRAPPLPTYHVCGEIGLWQRFPCTHPPLALSLRAVHIPCVQQNRPLAAVSMYTSPASPVPTGGPHPMCAPKSASGCDFHVHIPCVPPPYVLYTSHVRTTITACCRKLLYLHYD